MSKISQDTIVGMDVSRDWLDIHCLPDGASLRWPNNEDGHARIAALAAERHALVCFEGCEDQETIRGIVFPSGGGQEWRLWSNFDIAGIATRQLLPAQVKAFAASRGHRPRRVDAELIARIMAFRPDAGRRLPQEKLRFLRALTSKRGRLIETRKRLLMQINAQAKLGVADQFADMDANQTALLDRQIAELEAQIEQTIISDDEMSQTAEILRSVPRVGPVTTATLIAGMPELGPITGEQAAALTGLAPIAHDSAVMRGRRAIGGGR